MKHLEAISIAIQTGIPVMLWGDPGTGKSSFVNALAKSLDRHLETFIASIHDPVDLSGAIMADGDRAKYLLPDWAYRLIKAKNGILFLDELSTAPPSMQAGVLRVLLEHYVGAEPLPEGTSYICAGNPVETAAGGFELSAPLANRVCHIDWKSNSQDWVIGMLSGFKLPNVPKLPKDWKKFEAITRGEVTSFIQNQPQMLLQVPKEESKKGLAWASPRTWDMAIKLMAGCRSVGINGDVEHALLAGSVGDDTAITFMNWRKSLDLPNPEDLIENPKKLKLSKKRPDLNFAILNSVCSAVIQNNTPQRWEKAMEVMIEASKQEAGDQAAISLRVILDSSVRKDLTYKVPKGFFEAFKTFADANSK